MCSIESIVLTSKILIIVSILHLFFGVLIGAYLTYSKDGIAKTIVEILTTFPLIFPPIAIGFLALLIFGKDGFLGSFLKIFNIEVIFSFTGLVIASFIAGLPLIVKPIQSALESVPKNVVEISYTFGKSKLYTFYKIELPYIKSAIIAGVTLSIGRSLGEVGISLMLGGNIIGKTETISLAIYNAVFDGEFGCAIKLSITLGLVSSILFFVLRKLKTI